MDITTLKIEVDTTAVERATVALDALAESATKAKAALDALGSQATNRTAINIHGSIESIALSVVEKHMRPDGMLNPAL